MRFYGAMLLWVVISVQAGCATRSEDIDLKDPGVFIKSVRMRLDRSPMDPAEPRVMAELDFVYGAGDATQELDPTEFLRLKGKRFEGSQMLEHELELLALSIAMKPEFRISDSWFHFAPMAGYGVQEIRLKVKGDEGSRSDRTRTNGPMFGGQLRMEPRPWFDLYGRVTLSTGIFGKHASGLARTEWGAALKPFERVALRVAWSDLHYNENRSHADIDATLSGLLVGLDLTF